MTQGAIQVDPVDAMVAELEQMVRSDCAQGLFWPSDQTRAARENLCHALRRAALPVAPSDELMRNMIFEAGWRTAAKWANRDDLYADTGSAAYKRDRDAVLGELDRLLEQASPSLPVAALSDADRELMEQALAVTDDLVNWMPRVEPAKGQQEAVDESIEKACAFIAALRSRIDGEKT